MFRPAISHQQHEDTSAPREPLQQLHTLLKFLTQPHAPNSPSLTEIQEILAPSQSPQTDSKSVSACWARLHSQNHPRPATPPLPTDDGALTPRCHKPASVKNA